MQQSGVCQASNMPCMEVQAQKAAAATDLAHVDAESIERWHACPAGSSPGQQPSPAACPPPLPAASPISLQLLHHLPAQPPRPRRPTPAAAPRRSAAPWPQAPCCVRPRHTEGAACAVALALFGPADASLPLGFEACAGIAAAAAGRADGALPSCSTTSVAARPAVACC